MSLLGKMKGNLAAFLNNDNMKPNEKYGIDPPKPYSMGRTDPRYSRDPSAGTMAPNPQAGSEIRRQYGDRFTKEQRFAERSSEYTGDERSIAFPVKDSRVPTVKASGKNDYQVDPHLGDPRNTRASTFGRPQVPFTGAESFLDNAPSIIDRDPGEVGTPVIYGDQSEYDDNAFEGVESPRGFLGNASIAPAISHYPSKRVDEKPDSHEVEWNQPHPNAVAHTGHEDDFGHIHHVPLKVTYSSSVGNKGTDYLPTVGGGPIERVPHVPNLDNFPVGQTLSHYN